MYGNNSSRLGVGCLGKDENNRYEGEPWRMMNICLPGRPKEEGYSR